MTDINHVILVGRLTKDLDSSDSRSFGYVGNGMARANVSIAVNRSRKNGEQWVDETSFFDVVIWGKTAENLKPYLTKGKQIAVDGYLKQYRWEKDGKTSSRVVIHANSVQLMGSSKSDGNSETNGGASRFQPRNDVPQMQNSGMPDYGSNSYSDPLSDIGDDIPF